jgi:excisionase family DNA binding protein
LIFEIRPTHQIAKISVGNFHYHKLFSAIICNTARQYGKICHMENLYTVRTAAEKMQLHPESVRRIIRSGELRAVKMGKSWRLRESDLTNYIATRPTNQDRADQTPAAAQP